MSLASDLMSVHAEALLEVQGDRFEYERTAVVGEGGAFLTMVRGQTEQEIRTPDGGVIEVHAEDFLVSVAEFREKFGPDAVPEDDDKISDPRLGRVYRAKPLNGEPCFRRTQAGLMFRIHVKDDGPYV